MAIGRPLSDFSQTMNSVYKITLDMSGWSQTTIQVVAPITGVLYVYSSNDGDFVNGSQQGNASLAINFTPTEVTNLATHAVVNSISAAGLYKADINAQYLRLQGNPTTGGTITNVYKLLLFNSKID